MKSFLLIFFYIIYCYVAIIFLGVAGFVSNLLLNVIVFGLTCPFTWFRESATTSIWWL